MHKGFLAVLAATMLLVGSASGDALLGIDQTPNGDSGGGSVSNGSGRGSSGGGGTVGGNSGRSSGGGGSTSGGSVGGGSGRGSSGGGSTTGGSVGGGSGRGSSGGGSTTGGSVGGGSGRGSSGGGGSTTGGSVGGGSGRGSSGGGGSTTGGTVGGGSGRGSSGGGGSTTGGSVGGGSGRGSSGGGGSTTGGSVGGGSGRGSSGGGGSTTGGSVGGGSGRGSSGGGSTTGGSVGGGSGRGSSGGGSTTGGSIGGGSGRTGGSGTTGSIGSGGSGRTGSGTIGSGGSGRTSGSPSGGFGRPGQNQGTLGDNLLAGRRTGGSNSGTVRYGSQSNGRAQNDSGPISIGRITEGAWREDRAGRTYDRNPNNYRRGYYAYSRDWRDDYFYYPHYSFQYSPNCYPSPFYYYPHLPAYINVVRVNLNWINITLFDTCRNNYNWNGYGYWGNNGSWYSNGRHNELDYAIGDIYDAFRERSPRLIGNLIPSRGSVAIEMDGGVRYRLNGDDFYDLMWDLVGGTNTTNYRIINTRTGRGEALIEAEHEYLDPWGRRQYARHIYGLGENRGRYEIQYFAIR